jgi:hypothetical protein
MGSSMSRIYDDMAAEQWQKDKEWLQKLSNEIKDINPSSCEFRDLKMVARKQRAYFRKPKANRITEVNAL